MPQAYSDPSRELDQNALPDLEVFYASTGEFDVNAYADNPPTQLRPCEAGWYWQACFPGRMPDGEPMGPFKTEAEALADAREGVETVQS
jgi:hypothetical protein